MRCAALSGVRRSRCFACVCTCGLFTSDRTLASVTRWEARSKAEGTTLNSKLWNLSSLGDEQELVLVLFWSFPLLAQQSLVDENEQLSVSSRDRHIVGDLMSWLLAFEQAACFHDYEAEQRLFKVYPKFNSAIPSFSNWVYVSKTRLRAHHSSKPYAQRIFPSCLK